MWALPVLPDKGDEDPDETFKSIGIAISSWESLEFELARLFSVYVNDPDGDAWFSYGEGRIFRERLLNLRSAAKSYVVRYCSQEHEGDLNDLLQHAVSAADRRNDIAHGIVFRIDQLTFFRNKLQVRLWGRPHWALIPPAYLARRHDDGLPQFAYTSHEIKRTAKNIIELGIRISALREQLSGG